MRKGMQSVKITIAVLLLITIIGIGYILVGNFKTSDSSGKKSKASEVKYPETLIKTRWGQDLVYARFTPKNELTGCWSTALAQILYYHNLAPSGRVEYKTKTRYVIKEDLDSFIFKWDDLFDAIEYGQTEGQKDQVGKYLYFTACVIQKNFGGNNYMLHGEDMARELSSHYGCDAKWYGQEKYSSEAIGKVIIEELNEKRPVMLYFEGNNNGHAVVVDGYTTDNTGELLIHINMGYRGRDNGWYKFNDPIQDFDTLGIREIITIEPKK